MVYVHTCQSCSVLFSSRRRIGLWCPTSQKEGKLENLPRLGSHKPPNWPPELKLRKKPWRVLDGADWIVFHGTEHVADILGGQGNWGYSDQGRYADVIGREFGRQTMRDVLQFIANRWSRSRDMGARGITLGQIEGKLEMLDIDCYRYRCSRHGRLSVARLIAKHGVEMSLPELRSFLTIDCPHARSTKSYNRCDVHCPQLRHLFPFTT